MTKNKKLTEIKQAGGNGFLADNKIYLRRCPDCKRENYALMVASGVCAWCGYDANKEGK